MGHKSRGSWNINFCMKSDCRVRDYGIAISGIGTTGKTTCDECIRYSNYQKQFMSDICIKFVDKDIKSSD